MTNDLPTDLRIMALKYQPPLATLLDRAADKIDALTLVDKDTKRLTKEIDIILNGDKAAEQASLCDIVAQFTVIGKSIKRAEENTSAALKLLHVPNDGGSDE